MPMPGRRSAANLLKAGWPFDANSCRPGSGSPFPLPLSKGGVIGGDGAVARRGPVIVLVQILEIWIAAQRRTRKEFEGKSSSSENRHRQRSAPEIP